MKYLLFNWENVEISDPADLSNEEFEKLAEKHGVVINSHKDFESQFNNEMFSVHTHQLRIVE